MGEINLLQPGKKSKFEVHAPAGSGSFLLWSLIILMALELAGFGALFFMRKRVDAKTAGQQAQIAELDGKINSRRDELKAAVTDQGMLTSFSSLLDSHIRWSSVWKTLGEYTLKVVQYLNIETTAEQDKFVVSGRVSNFTEVGKLLLGLQASENFTKVELMNTKSGEAGQTGIEFQISITLKRDLLVPPVVPVKK